MVSQQDLMRIVAPHAGDAAAVQLLQIAEMALDEARRVLNRLAVAEVGIALEHVRCALTATLAPPPALDDRAGTPGR